MCLTYSFAFVVAFLVVAVALGTGALPLALTTGALPLANAALDTAVAIRVSADWPGQVAAATQA